MQRNLEPEEFFPAVLSELLYGNEQQEPLEKLLDRVITPQFRQRINGSLYNRQEYLHHVREMRAKFTGGRLEVLEQMREGNRIAGRYTFHVTLPTGAEMQFESHIFGELADDGRLCRMAEVARKIEDADNGDLIRTS